MKSTSRLRVTTKLKTSLRRRLIIGAVGFCIAIATCTTLILNFNAGDSRASEIDDEQQEIALQLLPVCSENPLTQKRWKIINPNTYDLPIQWDVYPELQTGLLIAHPGENFIITNTIEGSNVLRIRWQNKSGEWFDLMQPASAETCPSSGCYATEVVSYFPAKRNDGTTLPAEQQMVSKAIGVPQGNDAAEYVSLGFGGEITLKFADPIANGPGDDLMIHESTMGAKSCERFPEKAMVFASQDGCHFIYLGEACQDASFDLGAMSWIRFVKLKDISPVTYPYGNQTADGYDLDAIQCLNGTANTTPDDGLVAGSAQEVSQYVQGTRKNGTNIHPSRTNPEMALGVPQNDDLGINFVSLGFTGMIALKFDYVVFNREGNDLQVIETSYGIAECQIYPEQAFFEGSLDGESWFAMGEVCLDGELDLGAGVYAIQYIRVTDRSAASNFPNSADGFDLDGIIVLDDCPGQARIQAFDNITTPDEIAEIKMSPNPFRDISTLEYETGSVDERVNIAFYNYVGQMVHSERVKIPKNTRYQHPINGGDLPKGVYIVSVESGGQKQSIRVIKN